MAKLELIKVLETCNRTYYLVNDYLPVMKHLGWSLVRGKSNYRHPPFVLEDAPSFPTVEELVTYWHAHIAPYKVLEAKELIKFYEGVEECSQVR